MIHVYATGFLVFLRLFAFSRRRSDDAVEVTRALVSLSERTPPPSRHLFLYFLLTTTLGVADGLSLFAMLPALGHAVGTPSPMPAQTAGLQGTLFGALAVLGGLQLFRVAIRFAISRLSTAIRARINETLSVEAYGALLSAPVAATAALPVGERLQGVSGARAVAGCLHAQLDAFKSLVLISIFATSFALLARFELAIFALLAWAGHLLLQPLLNRSSRHSRALQAGRTSMSTFLVDTLSRTRLVKQLNVEHAMLDRMRAETTRVKAAELAHDDVHAWIPAAQQAFQLATCAALYLTLKAMTASHAELITLAALTLAGFRYMHHRVGEIFQAVVRVTSTAAELQSLRKVLALGKETGGARPVGARPRLALAGVSVTIEGRTILDGIDAALSPGETVLIVGPTGAGKTSFLHLFGRFLEPTAGRVTLDGAPLGDYDLGSLRDAIHLLPQDPGFFAGTLRDNLTLGLAETPSDEEIVDLLRELGLSTWLEGRRDGLDAPLATGEISTGERKRLALARALLRRAAYLLLDEMTSNLDAATARRVIEVVKRRRPETTLVIVTHDASLADHADRVISLAAGRIVEDGRPHALADTGYFKSRFLKAS